MKHQMCRLCKTRHPLGAPHDFSAFSDPVRAPERAKPIVNKPAPVNKPPLKVVNKPQVVNNSVVVGAILGNMVNNEKIRSRLDKTEARRIYMRDYMRKQRA